MVNFRQGLMLFCMLILFASCATIQQDIHYGDPQGAAWEELKELELQLVNVRSEIQERALSGNGDVDTIHSVSAVENADQMRLLEAIQEQLIILQERPETNPLYRARVQALLAETALLNGLQGQARQLAGDSRKIYGGDEITAIVLSRLERDPADQEQLLSASRELVDSEWRILAELGAVYSRMGEYGRAVASFEQALPELPLAYSRLYGRQREAAFALRDARGPMTGRGQGVFADRPISCAEMITAVQENSTLLDWFTGGASWSSTRVFTQMQQQAWFTGVQLSSSDTLTRGLAAMIFWRLISNGDQSYIGRYSRRYGSDRRSPILDVDIDDPWFDAVLGLVEAEIMMLPDGRRFFPNQAVTGLELFGLIQRANDY